MDKTALESLLSSLDKGLIVCAALAAISAVGGFVLGYIRFRRGNELVAILAEENLAQKRAMDEVRLETAKATERAAEANRIAEEERLARVKIEERLADRRLTAEEQASLSSKLKPFARQKINVVCPHSPEPMQICLAMFAAFADAKWQFGRMLAGLSRPIRGMLVEVDGKADTDAIAAAGALAGALKSAGLEVLGPIPMQPGAMPGMYQGDAVVGAQIMLTIGPK